jgi:lysozyme
MDLSKAKKLIIKYEGLRLEAYKDPVGIWTIGFGSTRIFDRQVCEGDKCDRTQAEIFLDEHIEIISRAIKKLIKVEVTENEFCALVSFAYNVGVGALRYSTLLRKLNDKHPKEMVAAEFARWNKAGSKVLAGLVTRRKDEADLFLS